MKTCQKRSPPTDSGFQPILSSKTNTRNVSGCENENFRVFREPKKVPEIKMPRKFHTKKCSAANATDSRPDLVPWQWRVISVDLCFSFSSYWVVECCRAAVPKRCSILLLVSNHSSLAPQHCIKRRLTDLPFCNCLARSCLMRCQGRVFI